MKLRKLVKEDAPFMLEWMHDRSVVQDLKADFLHKTMQDCLTFIENAQDEKNNLHLAIASDDNEYMGTVSLKNIRQGTAEFGITVRKEAMGKGFSQFAIKKIISYGFQRYQLNEVYWCVDPKNKRAIRFYDKNGYSRTTAPDQASGYSQNEKRAFLWYSIKRSETEGLEIE